MAVAVLRIQFVFILAMAFSTMLSAMDGGSGGSGSSVPALQTCQDAIQKLNPDPNHAAYLSNMVNAYYGMGQAKFESLLTSRVKLPADEIESFSNFAKILSLPLASANSMFLFNDITKRHVEVAQ